MLQERVNEMNVFKNEVLKKRIDKTIKNLERNNMQGYYVEKKEDVIPKLKELMMPGETVAVGGSVTLDECGVIDFLRAGEYRFLDRYAEGISREEMTEIFRQSFLADTYIGSANALTEKGEIYNVDGNGNRIAAYAYGPKSVIFVCGYNKIVSDLEGAVKRVKEIAAPANCLRLNINSACSKTGTCMSCNHEICCDYLVQAYQRVKDRIKVILVGEELGF